MKNRMMTKIAGGALCATTMLGALGLSATAAGAADLDGSPPTTQQAPMQNIVKASIETLRLAGYDFIWTPIAGGSEGVSNLTTGSKREELAHGHFDLSMNVVEEGGYGRWQVEIRNGKRQCGIYEVDLFKIGDSPYSVQLRTIASYDADIVVLSCPGVGVRFQKYDLPDAN